MSFLKFKANIIFNNIKIKCLLEMTNHFLKIAIIDKKADIKTEFELIKALFISMNYSKSYEFFINFVFFQNIKSQSESISIEINNPVSNNIIFLTLINLESVNLLFKKKLDINQIIFQLKKKIKEEKKYLIYSFNNMIFALRDFIDKSKKIKILENIKQQAYKFGKNYYESSALAFKKKAKIAKNINDNILLTKLKTMEQSLSQQEKMKKNISYTSFESLIGEFNMRTSYFIEETIVLFLKIICIGINSFDDINFNKFNLNQIFEEENKNQKSSVKKQFDKNNKSFTGNFKNNKLFNEEEDVFNRINNKNNNFQLEDSSTEGTSKKKNYKKKIYISQDDTRIPTPKFKQFNYKINKNQAMDNFSQNYYDNLSNTIQISINPFENINNITKNTINKKTITLNNIKKEIEELCTIHSLLIPDNIFNLFCNASEIIHRKFFQITMNSYLGKIFYLEEDKEGNIKMEDLYNYFLYVKALKLLLFNSEKKDYFMNNILFDD